MMKKMIMGSGEKGTVHPFILFWLGVLTGALLVGLAFFYGMWQNQDAQNAILKLTKPSIQTESIGGERGKIIAPIGGEKGK